jgi:hypothetical protein
MGKVAEPGDNPKRRGELPEQGVLEFVQLARRKGMKKALKDDHALAEGGIEIEMGGIKGFPILVGVRRDALRQILGWGPELAPEVFDELDEGAELVEELHLPCEEDLAEEGVEQGGALTAGDEEILRIEGGEIGYGAEMFGMREHGAEQLGEGQSEALTEGGGKGEDLAGFLKVSVASQADGLIEINTEHGVGGFEATQGMLEGLGFFRGERSSPVHTDRAMRKRTWPGVHRSPPRGLIRKYIKFL